MVFPPADRRVGSPQLKNEFRAYTKTIKRFEGTVFQHGYEDRTRALACRGRSWHERTDQCEISLRTSAINRSINLLDKFLLVGYGDQSQYKLFE